MEDDDYRALIEQAHQVRELTKHPGWDVFVDYLRFGGGGAARKQHDLVNGAAKDYVDYSRIVGWLDGVDYAINAPERLDAQTELERKRRAEVAAYEAESA